MLNAFKKANTAKPKERGFFERLASGLMMMMLTVSISSILVSGSLFIWLFQEQIKVILTSFSTSWYAFGVACAAFLLIFCAFVDLSRRWAQALENSAENAAAILHSMKAQDQKAQAPQIFVVPTGQGQAGAFGSPVVENLAAKPRARLATPKKKAQKNAFIF